MPPRLIERVKSGDEAAFIELVKTYQQTIRSFVASWAPSRGEADEIAQDVFVTASHSFDTFDSKQDFNTWLLGIARNMTRNAWRRLARSTQHNNVTELCAILERHAVAGNVPPATNSDERTEYFAGRHSQGTLDANDFAEMATLFKQPQVAQNFVSVLAARYAKDFGTQSGDAFVKAVLERKQGKLDPSRTKRHEAQKPRGTSMLLPMLAVGVASVVLIYFLVPGKGRTDTLRKDGGLKLSPVEAKPANSKLTHIIGYVLIHRGELTKECADGMELFIGDIIETGRGSAVISYSEELVTLSLGSGTELQMNLENNSHRPRLLKGTVDVVVSQAKEPQILLTPSAEMQAIDAELTLGIEGNETFVQVHAGDARMIRTLDGVAIDVTAGNSKIISAHSVQHAATGMKVTRPWRERDIGANKIPGSSLQKDDVFTLKASGVDLSDRADGFHFVYQPLNGDCDFTARVVSIADTKDWALAGIMVRETMAPDSPHATLLVKTQDKVLLRRRLCCGEGTESSAENKTPLPLPRWLKLTRSGNLFTTYTSTDGKVWILVDEVAVRMNENVFAGLVLLNHDNSGECTGVFESVKLLRLTPP